MAYSTQQSAPRIAGFANPAILFEGMVDRFAGYMRYRRTLAELSDLSDRQLADLGLTRSMLQATAMEAAFGRTR